MIWCSSTAPLVKVAVCLLLETADLLLAATSLEQLMVVMKVELYCTVLHCTALYCTVLYCTVL